jgi:Tol biopolymer transport system component
VAKFADQRQAAEAARRRLNAAPFGRNQASSGTNSRVLWTLPDAVSAQGQISRDGRWLSYIDWSTNNLALHDFQSGRNVKITDTGVLGATSQQQYPGYSRLSPDGKRIVFSWFNNHRYELRLLAIDPAGKAKPDTLYHNPDVEYVQPFAWSPDGGMVAVGLQRADRTGQLALVSVRDGSLRVLKSFPWRE